MNKNGEKDFRGWMKIKEETHNARKIRHVSEGEVWWCRIGENVGNEISGKGRDFVRPVMVIKKLSRDNFIGVPLTSKKHVGSWYVRFIFKDKEEYAVVAQVENISTFRLVNRVGRVPGDDLYNVKIGLIKLLKNAP